MIIYGKFSFLLIWFISKSCTQNKLPQKILLRTLDDLYLRSLNFCGTVWAEAILTHCCSHWLFQRDVPYIELDYSKEGLIDHFAKSYSPLSLTPVAKGQVNILIEQWQFTVSPKAAMQCGAGESTFKKVFLSEQKKQHPNYWVRVVCYTKYILWEGHEVTHTHTVNDS